MRIRVEPFVQGFMISLRPQMTPQDRELLTLVFRGAQPYTRSSIDESNPSKASYYFRFHCNHLNVLLPTWILNGRSSSRTDRFRIASTADHSVVIDVKESIIYDPTIETAHSLAEFRPLFASDDWKEESWSLIREELSGKRLAIRSFAERVEQIPDFYDAFCAYVQKHRLKNRLEGFRFGLDFGEERIALAQQSERDRALVEAVTNELWSRSAGRAA